MDRTTAGRMGLGARPSLLLEAYYEPQFSARSHGFRPGRGCHTALDEIASTWTGTTWFIEGDIKACFDNVDHHVLMDLVAERMANIYLSVLDRHFSRIWDTEMSPLRRRAKGSQRIKVLLRVIRLVGLLRVSPMNFVVNSL
ncbi:reverse transcriptase/maturase family protein [Streptomyces phaeochromogenes]|nr:reverse transcriptase/maturase family protein [Streptomyces phaeochromogenes]